MSGFGMGVVGVMSVRFTSTGSMGFTGGCLLVSLTMSTGGSGMNTFMSFGVSPLLNIQRNPACSSTMMASAQLRGEFQLCSDGKLLIVVAVIDLSPVCFQNVFLAGHDRNLRLPEEMSK
jgi:hypothetical protein